MKVDIGNFQINIETSGNTSGPIVMMAHSLGCNLRMWDPQMAILEADFHVVRPVSYTHLTLPTICSV